MTTTPPAVIEYLAEVEHNARRDTLRRILELARDGTLTEAQAAYIALGAGYPLTVIDVQDGVRFLDDSLHPDAALDRLEYDEGPITGPRLESLDRVQSLAQHDLDTLIDKTARNATPLDANTVLLNAIDVLWDAS